MSTLAAGKGRLAISPAPGRFGDYPSDLATLAGFGPELVVSMTEMAELDRIGASGLPRDLAARGIGWLHLPIVDFGAPTGATGAAWPAASGQIRPMLTAGGRVLVHCMGGCGRSGMVALRLLCEMGEPPEAALMRLRTARPCAVETEDQMRWACAG